MIERLIEAAEKRYNALYEAKQKGHYKVTKLLLESGPILMN